MQPGTPAVHIACHCGGGKAVPAELLDALLSRRNSHMSMILAPSLLVLCVLYAMQEPKAKHNAGADQAPELHHVAATAFLGWVCLCTHILAVQHEAEAGSTA